jgi:hypothetical protein
MDVNDEEELIKAAMSVLGKRTSPKKKASSRENAKRPRHSARGKKKKRRTIEKPTDSNLDANSEQTPEINKNKEVVESQPIANITFHEEGN